MRLSVFPDLSTKDGVTDENARMTNALKEVRAVGDMATIRPGLVTSAVSVGNGNGLVSFNGELVSIFGASVGVPSADEVSITSNSYNISGVVVLDTVKLGSYWLLMSDSQIYSTTDFVTFTPLLTPGLYFLFNPECFETNGTIAVIAVENEDGDIGNLVIDTALTVTAHFDGVDNLAGSFLVWTGTKFVGSYGSILNSFSTNGITWTLSSSYTAMFSSRFAYGNGIICQLGTPAASNDVNAIVSLDDGATWSSPVLLVSAAGSFSICWAGDRFVASGRDWVATSTDGVSWSLIYPFPYNFSSVRIAYSSTADTVLALGSYAYYGIPQTKMLSFDNGLTWIDANESVYNGIEYSSCLADGNGFVTTGSTVVSGAANNIEVIGTVSVLGTITDLTSLTNSRHDFVQSPI